MSSPRTTKVMSGVDQENGGLPVEAGGVAKDIADLGNDLAETETDEMTGVSSGGQEEPTEEERALRRSSRQRRPNPRYLDFLMLTDSGEPENHAETSSSGDVVKWECAMGCNGCCDCSWKQMAASATGTARGRGCKGPGSHHCFRRC